MVRCWSHDHIYDTIWFTWQNNVSDIMVRRFGVITFIWKYLYFRKPKRANFADIIKITARFSKTTFKESKTKRLINYVLKCNLYPYFLTKVASLWWKYTNISRTEGVCHVIYFFFWINFREDITAKFHHSGVCVTDVREGESFWPQLYQWFCLKRLILNSVKKSFIWQIWSANLIRNISVW